MTPTIDKEKTGQQIRLLMEEHELTMSRSFKKNPVFKDSTRKGATYKSGKQIANRTVRRKLDIPKGSGYKKMFCSYNISDYSFRMSERELMEEWEKKDSWIRRQFKTLKQAHHWWKKYYQMK